MCFFPFFKGFRDLPDGGIELISDVIKNELNINVSVLMGANLANEVADENFCETTIGSIEQIMQKMVYLQCVQCVCRV